MPPPEFHTLLTALILTCGAGIFLRLVGKEKHRREKWLQLRLKDKFEELKKTHPEVEALVLEPASVDDTPHD